MVTGSFTIGPYRVLHKLGEGGMGVVYLAEHSLLGRKAAIKVLLPELSSQQEIVQRFFNEARAVTQISDPGIVQVFDFGHSADGSAYIVMELLEGESMDKRLERIGRFSAIEAIRLARLICTSLAHAHGKGIVHRDLKPENIFIVGDLAVTGGERAKILDFGIAKLTADEPGKMKTRTGMVMGTPVYMSPEQCRGAGEIDHRSDIYTMGCVLFTMLSGRPPFDGEGFGELIAAHLREPPPQISSRITGLPEEIDHVLQTCLAKSPGDRFANMRELVTALEHIEQLQLGSLALTMSLAPYAPRRATLPSAPTTLSSASGQAPPATRSRGVLAGAFVACVAIAGFAMYSMRGPGDAEPATAAASAPPIAIPVARVTPDAGVDAAVDAPTVIVDEADDAAVESPPPIVAAPLPVVRERGPRPPAKTIVAPAVPAAVNRGD